jgi:hypothetical protein
MGLNIPLGAAIGYFLLFAPLRFWRVGFNDRAGGVALANPFHSARFGWMWYYFDF